MIDDAILKNIFLFKNLDKKETQLVRSLLKEKSFRAKQKVVEEGKPGKSLYIISSGKVRVTRGFDKEDFALTELGAYDFFGEMSLIDDYPTSATVETLAKTTLLEMTRSDFKKLVSKNSELSAKLWESVAKSLTMRIRKTGDLVKMYYAINKALSESSSW